jgi:hypothetical protein
MKLSQAFSCEGFKTEEGLTAICSVTVSGFRNEEELTTFVLSMKAYLQDASKNALKVALPKATTITVGEEEVDYGNNVRN